MDFSSRIPSPANAIHLNPSQDIQAVVALSAAGTTFVLDAGVYKNVTIAPKDNMTFIGAGGAVMDGARDISGWHFANGLWMASGFPAPSYSYGEGRNGMAQYVEDLLVEGTPYLRVATRAELGAGKFYYENGNVYLSSDPSGHHTEYLSTSNAFAGGTTKGVTVANLTVQHYASMAQHGAIEGHSTQNWKLVDVNAVDNHGAGVAAGSNMQILGGDFSNNGEIGIHGFDISGLTINGVKATNNNYAGFDQTWDAGGIKVLTSTNTTVQNSEISLNHGFGLWFDWDNKNITIRNNLIQRNEQVGLFYEASYDGSISGNNIGLNNTSQYAVGYWGADLLMNNSSNVTVTGNQIVSDVGAGIGLQQASRDPGIYGAHVSTNNIVSGNKIIMVTAGLNGAALDGTGGGNNTWDSNSYVADAASSLWFTWNSQFFSAQNRGALPIEQHGQFAYSATPTTAAAAGFLTTMGVSLPHSFTAIARQLKALPGIIIADTDTKAMVTVAVTSKLGTLATQATPGVTAVGQGEHTLTLSGNVTAVDTALATLGYQAGPLSAGVSAIDTLAVAASDNRGLSASQQMNIVIGQAAAPASSSDVFLLTVSEDAWQGDAQFTLSVDGQQVGGTRVVTASHGAGATQQIAVTGQWGTATSHHLAITFLNDAYSGNVATGDRNLYVDAISYNGRSVAGALAVLYSNGTADFTTTGPAPAKIATALTLHLAEDAWQGDARYSVAVDGTTLATGSATASHAAGQQQSVALQAMLAAGSHDIAVSFVNDAWGGTPATDRNLYVRGIDAGGTALAGAEGTLYSNGTLHFALNVH